ncbi:MAG: hypothetical protein ACR2OV_17195, partial [Hyphomicrobiaceae bacterium]
RDWLKLSRNNAGQPNLAASGPVQLARTKPESHRTTQPTSIIVHRQNGGGEVRARKTLEIRINCGMAGEVVVERVVEAGRLHLGHRDDSSCLHIDHISFEYTALT